MMLVMKCRGYTRIGLCLGCVYRVIEARGKFGEHERSVRVAREAIYNREQLEVGFGLFMQNNLYTAETLQTQSDLSFCLGLGRRNEIGLLLLSIMPDINK